MANRTRKRLKLLYVTEKENALIADKMKQLGTRNFSLYARQMLVNGEVVKKDYTEVKLLTRELANLARSINQIALRANETRSIYKKDIYELQQSYGQVKAKVSEHLVKLTRQGDLSENRN